MKPLCIDLFCGLGGWTEGFLAEGWEVVGFDNHRHSYGGQKYPAQLVLQDVLTIHGSQFRNTDCIVASPPCQSYSWLAMPWSRSKSTKKNLEPAKALRRKWETDGPDNRLFNACFRIQREAIEATQKTCRTCHGTGVEDYEDGYNCDTCGGLGWTERRYIPLIVENVRGAQEWVGRSAWNAESFHLWGDIPAIMPLDQHRKQGDGKGDWFNKEARAAGASAIYGSKSPERKQASAEYAKIPLALSSHIASVYYPKSRVEVCA